MATIGRKHCPEPKQPLTGAMRPTVDNATMKFLQGVVISTRKVVEMSRWLSMPITELQ
jgi:hypothetical protein